MTVAEIAQQCFLNSPNWRNQNPLVIPDESTRRTAATPHGKAHSWMLGYDHRPDENHQESPTSSLNKHQQFPILELRLSDKVSGPQPGVGGEDLRWCKWNKGSVVTIAIGS